MIRHSLRTLALSAAVAVTGCADQAPTGPDRALDGRGVTVQVAPLELPDVDDVDWGLRVLNASGDVVFHQPSLRARQYGDGQSLTYVGPCDASADEQPNRVELTLNALYAAGGAAIDASTWQNPTDPLPLARTVVCAENADTRVDFDLTILRAANQGFFDVAVDFDDIFCSAKVDCGRQDEPILLTFDPDTGARVPTAVLGLACTAGVGSDTHLYLDDLELACDGDATWTIDVAAGPGNLYSAADGASPAPAGAPFSQVQTFRGRELLRDAGDASIEKLYWNVAIGMDADGFSGACALRTTATATDGPLVDFATDPDATYPVIRFAVDPFIADGALACGQHPLNGQGSGVTTSYTTPPATEAFDHLLRRDGADGLALETYVAPIVTITPTDVLASHAQTACALTGGLAQCWGANTFLQTGAAGTGPRFAPYTQTGVPAFDEVDAGIHGSCARAGGEVWCWGTVSAYSGSAAAVRRNEIATAVQVGVGDNHVCGLRADGGVVCWGENTLGQTSGSGLGGVAQIDVNDHHACALLAGSGAVRCWGRNNNGQLGKGAGSSSCGSGGDTCERSPVAVAGVSGAVGVAVGHNAACALFADGPPQCWGANASGQLGTGAATGNELGPVVAAALPDDLVQIAIGSAHACGVTTLGEVYCWGSRSFGRVGDGETSGLALAPVRVDVPQATEVEVGHSHSCAALTTGEIYCWGQHSAGQCGTGEAATAQYLAPVPVALAP